MTAQLPNLWITIDLPVLREAARLLEVEHEREANVRRIADALGLDIQDVTRSLVRLYEDGYVGGADASTMGGRSVIATEMTARGRREVGMWPSSKDGAALIEAIENAINSTEDEDKKGFLREMARSGRNVGEGTLASIIAAVAARMTMGA